jgi:type IV secretory pathway VirD2 relaxase
LQHLETMGLAAEGEPGQWAVAEGAQAKLRELGARGDIIRTIGAALKDRGQDRSLDSYAVLSGAPDKPIAGRLIDKGLHDELTGTAYAVIDGTDGRTHHVRLPASRRWSTARRSAASSSCAQSASPASRSRP